MAGEESVWRKLTRLFRSGPVVRHKIAAGEKIQEPQGSAKAFKKELSSLYVRALASYANYERLSRYSDYNEMEYTPELHSALDIYADEATVKNDDGDVVEITSNNAEIKDVLETLFHEVININFNSWSWMRHFCKFGDFVLFVDATEENGILNLIPIPINEIEREEGYDIKDPMAVRFRWQTRGNTILENWQVIHFRLLGNDAYLPYGSSVLEPARRIWRQLILIEDAMLVYRIVRSPERRVFHIEIANTPPEQVDAFIEQVKTQMKRNTIVDSSTGRVDLRYNPLSVEEDYFLPKRGEQKSQIDTLAGGQFTGDIEDVQYIQSKMFSAIKIPRAYLGYEENLGSKATLAQEDVRFAKTIERIQSLFISELNKIAMIHLYLLGYRDDEIANFEIKMSSPSTVASQQRLELWRMKLEVAAMAQEGIFDRSFMYRRIFGLNDKQIAAIKDGKRIDKLEDTLLTSIETPPPPPPTEGEAPPMEEPPAPGAEELPQTLGGEGGEAPPPVVQVASFRRRGPLLGEAFDRNAVQPGTIVKVDSDETLTTREFKVTDRVARGNRIFYRGHFVDEEGTGKLTGNSVIDQGAVIHGRAAPRTRLVPADAVYEDYERKIFKKKNMGSTGNDSSFSVAFGKDLFSTGENALNLTFGTEKQTASDPNDFAAMGRMISRPFSEDEEIDMPGISEIDSAEEMIEAVGKWINSRR